MAIPQWGVVRDGDGIILWSSDPYSLDSTLEARRTVDSVEIPEPHAQHSLNSLTEAVSLYCLEKLPPGSRHQDITKLLVDGRNAKPPETLKRSLMCASTPALCLKDFLLGKTPNSGYLYCTKEIVPLSIFPPQVLSKRN